MRSFYIADNGQQRGPYAPEQMAGQGLRRDSLVWAEGMGQWVQADQIPELAFVLPPGPAVPSGFAGTSAPGQVPPGYASVQPPIGYHPSPGSDVQGKKLAAGLCGIFLGTFGVHKFILGYTGAGVIMLLSTLLTCGIAAPIIHIIGVIEGILYISKGDEQFYQEYILQRKSWF